MVIDLRSDTVTKPTPEMIAAMARAEVGDDYYGDDPTVKELETTAAMMLGKEDGLFVSSGTMGNLVSVLSHTQRGDSMIVEAEAHIYRCEVGHFATVAGVVPKRVNGYLGRMAPRDVEAALIGDGVLYATTRLICLENTHNGAGGTCLDTQYMEEIHRIASSRGLALHVDGARIFNASVALGASPAELVRNADSVTFCLSKGLACPYGSVVVGSKEFIKRARKYRQMVGGGMRQAGFMAAAGVVALQTMVGRLAEDHENARLLAQGLMDIGFEIDMASVQTNMVFSMIPESVHPLGLVQELKKLGVLVNPPSGRRLRMVTHYGISRADIDEAIQRVGRVIRRH